MNKTKQKTIELAYLILRLTMGINMLTHGIARMLNLEGFNSWMIGQFSNTILPEFMVSISSYMIPFTELILGILLILGLFTARALLVGGLLIVLLVFGSGLQENWNVMSSQMIYAIFFFILSYFIELNRFSIDKFREE
ncbi:DoxX family membrane protein [Poseidonibacter ostreae]|mgnify:CR=1 FL=1|jgi:thiosulfate dehydrogenase (quinone) large subunit|uniref:DoxX family membrane protein n=1 Tax=Poseidonibacter ostreae TaxID=2654171 RepID=A0A6L4WWA6_9BACT|nr:DoxX family membrane protein [Poseidonibacter ostreae]KAB7887350.1 DoxX family membrane protein [Poseidonibacter ostreae]KAB7890076.1 DoxX family membrane protein [Poseidonibacter ostreae]KAB7890805.1 DoxX family membrane protein [Poseidonibacter ostreae]MAC83932.1 DoxX family protein [Arcobacter sp.]|tara:strand:- start:3250 stop:3663 length:414 start_codon:yes stop_codon:yes gene_type:complete